MAKDTLLTGASTSESVAPPASDLAAQRRMQTLRSMVLGGLVVVAAAATLTTEYRPISDLGDLNGSLLLAIYPWLFAVGWLVARWHRRWALTALVTFGATVATFAAIVWTLTGYSIYWEVIVTLLLWALPLSVVVHGAATCQLRLTTIGAALMALASALQLLQLLALRSADVRGIDGNSLLFSTGRVLLWTAVASYAVVAFMQSRPPKRASPLIPR